MTRQSKQILWLILLALILWSTINHYTLPTECRVPWYDLRGVKLTPQCIALVG